MFRPETVGSVKGDSVICTDLTCPRLSFDLRESDTGRPSPVVVGYGYSSWVVMGSITFSVGPFSGSCPKVDSDSWGALKLTEFQV